jgi:hypothetical protein
MTAVLFNEPFGAAQTDLQLRNHVGVMARHQDASLHGLAMNPTGSTETGADIEVLVRSLSSRLRRDVSGGFFDLPTCVLTGRELRLV